MIADMTLYNLTSFLKVWESDQILYTDSESLSAQAAAHISPLTA